MELHPQIEHAWSAFLSVSLVKGSSLFGSRLSSFIRASSALMHFRIRSICSLALLAFSDRSLTAHLDNVDTLLIIDG
jgi:hypothetical protein